MKRFLIGLVLVLGFLGVNAQTREILELKLDAQHYFEKREYQEALDIYMHLDSVDHNPIYYYPIAICFLSQNDWRAIPYFEQCMENPSIYPPDLYYFTALSQQGVHNFDEAIRLFEIYKTHFDPSKKKEKVFIEQIDNYIDQCNYGKELMANPDDIEIHNFGPELNTEFPEYGPVLSADGKVLVFTSSRPDNVGAKRSKHDGHYTEDIFISYKTEKGWTKAEGIGTHINTAGNEATLGLSPDGQQLLVYHYEDEGMLTKSSGDIFISHLEGKEWTKIKKLPEEISSEKHWEPSACFSADGRKIYFTSNRDGGFGGTDLYVAHLLDGGVWGQVENLGATINTEGDEDAPFIHPDGKTLYFSSNGHRTMGGYDIFVSKSDSENNTWSDPKNIGYPINTAHDDLHVTWSPDGKMFYFSSSQGGGFGDKDLYYAIVRKEVVEEAEPEHVMMLTGIITDSTTATPIEAEITISDVDTEELVGVFHSNSATGKYIIVLPENRHYKMDVKADHYGICDESLKVPELQDFEVVEKNIHLCPND